MIDSHAHVADADFDSDRDDVLRRAREAGLTGIVCVGQDVASAERAVALARRGYPGLALVPTAGLHPHEARRLGEERDGLAALVARPEVVAVGETGLDFHYDRSPRDVQRESFRWHLATARRVGKPVVVHVREAHEEAIEDVAAEGRGVDAVLHCFTGTAELARRWLDLGASISFSGIVTFKNAGAVREAAALVPADRLLVETDSPFLAPDPLRGQRCEPAFVTRTAARLAELRGEPAARLAERTSENARRLFFRAASDARAPLS